MSRPSQRSGFTLIELSIVLVIIGLIVGGIVVGRGLIETAESRRLITAVQNYRTAILAFKMKYGCLPGDCTNATTFFTTGNGNGDGRINAAFWTLPSLTFFNFSINTVDNEGNREEMTLLNEHLAKASMIALAPFDRTSSPPTNMANKWYLNYGHPTWSLMALTNGYGSNVIRLNAMQMSASSWAIGFQSPSGSSQPGLEASMALMIDSKLDDGLPLTGMVRDENIIGGATAGISNLFGCANYSGTFLNSYNTSNTTNPWTSSGGAVAGPCGLSFHNQF